MANVPALTQTVTEAPLHDINPTLRGSMDTRLRHDQAVTQNGRMSAGSLVTVKAYCLMSWITGS